MLNLYPICRKTNSGIQYNLKIIGKINLICKVQSRQTLDVENVDNVEHGHGVRNMSRNVKRLRLKLKR